MLLWVHSVYYSKCILQTVHWTTILYGNTKLNVDNDKINNVCTQYLLVSHAALELEEEIVEIRHFIAFLVLASQEYSFKIVCTVLSQDTLLEAATFVMR